MSEGLNPPTHDEDMQQRLPISVMVFARNEEKTLAEAIEAVSPLAKQVIVMDGASTDDSARIGRQAGAEVVADAGKGKGLALRTGLGFVHQPIVVLMDADLSHNAPDIPALIAPIECGEADVVIASRIKGGSDEYGDNPSNAMRLAGNLLITNLVNWRFGVNLTDVLNGFKAVKRDFLASLPLVERSHAFEHEMVIKSLRRGGRVSEIPSHEFARRHGSSSLGLWRSAPIFLYTCARDLLLP